MIIWWLTVFLPGGLFALPICQNQQNSKDYAVLSALLPLHSGENCSDTQMRGIQQLAALEYGLSKVNADLNQYGDVKINLQILDTCSDSRRAVQATMKGLVNAEQTCIKTPLFLGYVGPDDRDIFANVIKVTSLLNKTHVLPYKIDVKERPSNVFFIGSDQAGVRARAILTMLRNLGWESYVSVIEDSIQMTNLLDTLVDFSDGRICPVKKPIVLPKSENGYINVYKELMENQEQVEVDGILVIVDTPDALRPLLKILSSSEDVQKPFVVYIISVGLKLWELSRLETLKMVVMQEATEFKAKKDIKQYFNNSLFTSYHEQTRAYKKNCQNDPMCLDSLEDELDSSIMPITYAVHLFANALKMSLDQKCKYNLDSTGICRNLQYISDSEWISILRTTSTIINGPEGIKRLRFQMETPHHVSVYLWNAIVKQYDLIATIANGDRLNFIKNVFLPALIRVASMSDHPNSCRSFKTKTISTTAAADAEEATVAKDDDDWSPIWDFLPNSEKNPNKAKDAYHTITVMLCIGLGFLIFMVVMIRVLYSVFKFKQSDDHSSNNKKRRAGTSKRSRRTGSVTSRRLSRVNSIISTRST